MKRVLDLTFTIVLGSFAIFICLVAAIIVWYECRSSPFFWQIRLGQYERPFYLLKLRTMETDTADGPSHEVGYSKILKIGGIIRAVKIDELPQLWNVLVGDMSLVGPRPGLIMQSELIKARRAYNVYSLLPGVSGVSQIAGADMSVPWKLAKLDATYIGPWSALRDLKILFHTFTGKGRGDAANKSTTN